MDATVADILEENADRRAELFADYDPRTGKGSPIERVEVPLTPADTVEVPTLDGSVEMDVPAGTQSGETFRLRGKGMPRLQRRGHGDMYVQVRIVTPEDLNDEQREALEAFAEAGGEDIDVEQGFFEKLRQSF